MFTSNNGNMLLVKRFLSHLLHGAMVMEAVTSGYIVTEIEEMRRAMNNAVQFALRMADDTLTAEERRQYDQAREIEGVGSIDARDSKGEE